MQAYCSSIGASLIEIYSQTEEDWVKNSFLLPETGGKWSLFPLNLLNWWISLHTPSSDFCHYSENFSYFALKGLDAYDNVFLKRPFLSSEEEYWMFNLGPFLKTILIYLRRNNGGIFKF